MSQEILNLESRLGTTNLMLESDLIREDLVLTSNLVTDDLMIESKISRSLDLVSAIDLEEGPP